jgi:hypothetical protein
MSGFLGVEMSLLARRSLHASLVLLLIAPMSVLAANDRGPLDNNFEISLGAFFMATDTQLRVDGQNNLTGTDVDWERDLGLKDKDRFRIDAFWRFAKNHKVRFMYYDNNRSGTHTLTRDISFDGSVFPVTTTVDAQLDTQILELAYEYAFVKNDKVEFSGSIGIHNMKFASALSGIITAGNGGLSAHAEREADVDGPFPVIGLHVLWHMGRNFYLDALGQAFVANVDGIDGQLFDYKIAANWFPTRHVGIGIGYNDFVTKFDVDRDSFTGRMRFDNGGPIAFLIASF